MANLLKQISRLEGLPVEVQQLLKFGGSTDFQAQNLPFTAEVVRLSQRQVRLLTSGSHLKEFRSLLQGGVFQLTLKVDPRKIAFYQKNATSADLLRLVAISQYNLTRRTGSLPFRAFILTPSDSGYRLSTFWRGYQLESLVKTTSALANQLHHVPTVSAISHPAKVASLVGVLSQRSAPATQLVSLISPASSAVICRTLEASVKGSAVQGSVVGTRHSQLLYRQRTLIGLINRVGR